VLHTVDWKIIAFDFYLAEDSTCNTLTSAHVLHRTAKTRRLP